MIEVEHLTKRYGGHTAVEDISFTVEDGCIYGLLGPNGAGKSTTMNIITGYISATDGTVRIDGHDIAEEPAEAKACIGYLPELPPLYPEMTTREYLLFVAELKGTLKKADRIAAVEHAAARAGLQGMEQRLIRNLSKGYRQRVGIAAALLGTPKVIILDEPTVGLDPAQMIEIRSLIRDLGKTHTVILSSHILSEVQSVCDRVLIIAHGRLVAQGTPEQPGGDPCGGGHRAGPDEPDRDRGKGRRGQLYCRQHRGHRPARCAFTGVGRGRLPGAGPARRDDESGGCIPAADRDPADPAAG